MRLIDADKLKETVEEYVLKNPVYGKNIKEFGEGVILSLIDNAPSVEPKRGRWVEADCSVCGYPVPTDSRLDFLSEADHHYCYNCGAKMDGDVNETG